MRQDDTDRRSRRDFLKSTAGLASTALASSGLAGTEFAEDFQASSAAQTAIEGRRLLLQGDRWNRLRMAAGRRCQREHCQNLGRPAPPSAAVCPHGMMTCAGGRGGGTVESEITRPKPIDW